jgi:putative sporulation protein YtxC
MLKRRFLIKQSILNFISENYYIDISGFIKFRLIEYKKLLSELIEKVINEFKVQNEYKEFIAMLKFFVDTQKNRISKLHIVFEKDGEYTILNKRNQNITTECFKDFINDSQSHKLSNEDLLISSLIALAPKKLIVHLTSQNYNKKILSTIEQIFTNKVVLNETIPMLQLV